MEMTKANLGRSMKNPESMVGYAAGEGGGAAPASVLALASVPGSGSIVSRLPVESAGLTAMPTNRSGGFPTVIEQESTSHTAWLRVFHECPSYYTHGHASLVEPFAPHPVFPDGR